MPELLLELFSEEIPARMQARGAADLKRRVVDGLKSAGLELDGASAYATARRLTLVIEDVAARSPEVASERKGPRVGAPEKALTGFKKAAGIASIDEAEIVTDPKKGNFYVVRQLKPGRDASDIIAEIVPAVMAKFPWPKSMRWGTSPFIWVRPLHGILCLFGGEIVPFEVGGITSGNETRGHRFMAPEPFGVLGFADYRDKLKARKVLLDSTERAALIETQAKKIAAKNKLSLVEDAALLSENAGLAEWPVVMLGAFDKAFLEVPGEVLTTAMKSHQKCFSLRKSKGGALSNHFALVSNLEASDGGKQIIAGNEKVIAARLADAKFFWDQDLKRPLDEMAADLENITFHEKLGSQKERVDRITELAFQIAGSVDADPNDARRAAQLAKADLVSGMVGEFPELQGLMGRYYAEKAGTKPEIARAIELHYKPKGPSDVVPLESDGNAVAIAVALADKLDTLVGFWAINEKPTGSGDPYQLRRAALGVIRIVLENDVRLSLGDAITNAIRIYAEQFIEHSNKGSITDGFIVNDIKGAVKYYQKPHTYSHFPEISTMGHNFLYAIDKKMGLVPFFADRLKVHLRDKGARHDLIDAVFALGGQDDLALVVKRVEALTAFLETDDGANLLAGVKRASNILTIEEKKDKTSYAGDYDLKLLSDKEELALAAAIESVKQDTVAAINVENFTGAMNALAELRAPVDAFFEHVTVNADDPATRENRLRLLSQIRAATAAVADFSKISG